MKKVFVIGVMLGICTVLLVGCGGKAMPEALNDETIKAYASQMSEEPLSGDITLNGIKYSIPFKAKQLEESGFRYNDYAKKGLDLEDNYYTDKVIMDDGKKGENTRIGVTLYNTSGETVKFEDAMIGEMRVKKCDDYKNTVVLPKGITLESTYDEVVEAYGEPDFDYSNETGFITYLESDIWKFGKELHITFDEETKVIKEVKLKNIPREE